MKEDDAWLDNRRPLRFVLPYLLVFYVLGIGGLVVVAPAIGAPALPTWIGGGIIIIAISVLVVRLIPTKVRVDEAGLVLVSPIRRVRVSWEDVQEGVFIVDEGDLSHEWARRYYSLHLLRTNRKKTIVWLDGPVARKLMANLQGPKGKVRIFSGARLIKEQTIQPPGL